MTSIELKEPPATSSSIGSQILISQVAIQGTGTLGTLSSAATISFPTTPGPWTSLGDWKCPGGFVGDIHMAAAYRVVTAADGSTQPLTWSWTTSEPGEGFNTSVVNLLLENSVSTTSSLDVVGSALCTALAAPGVFNAPAISTNFTDEVLVGLYGVSGSDGQRQQIDDALTNPLKPSTQQYNGGDGPAILPFFIYGTQLVSPFTGATGSYGPYPVQSFSGSGEGVGVLIGFRPIP